MTLIDSYSFGVIEIDDRRYRSDVIIYPDKVDDGWWRCQGHNLVPDDIVAILDYNPEVLVIGTGYYGAMEVSPEVRKKTESRGIKLVVEKTGQAVRIFNKLAEKNKVVAALHLTC